MFLLLKMLIIISNESPIAQAILNQKVGDIVNVNSPNGVYQVEITAIS